jgi:hypothetical protein
MLTDLSWLAPTKQFPPPEENDRLRRYEKYQMMYDGDHQKLWPELWSMTDLERADMMLQSLGAPKVLDFNWFHVEADIYADYMFGEAPILPDGLGAIVDRSNLYQELHNLARDYCKFGECVYSVSFNGGSRIGYVDPSIWFPIVDPDDVTNIRAHVLAWVFTEQIGGAHARLLKVEIHRDDSVEHQLWWMNGNTIDHQVPLDMSVKYVGVQPIQHHSIGYPLVFYAINSRRRGDVYGTSDFEVMANLVKELESRMVRIMNVLDIHSRPIMAGPDSMIETNPTDGTRKVSIHGRYIPLRGDAQPPQYIEWDGKLTSSFKEMEVITDMLYHVTDLSPAALGRFPTGQAVTGSAWRRLLVRTISRTNRIRLAFETPLRRALQAASKLDVIGRIPGAIEVKIDKIKFNDGLPRDVLEDARIEQARKNSGLTSKESAIRRLDECTEAEARAELVRIALEIGEPPREQSEYAGQARADLVPKV